MPFLPVDTAVVIEIGPLIDDTNFKTLETAIAYDESGMSCDLIKNSSTAITKVDLTLTSGGTSDWTHKGSGVYELEITAAQNDTEGTLRVVGLCDGVLPFESPVYTIVPVSVYDSLIAGTDELQVDAGDVADQVWDEARADHIGASSFGAALQDAYWADVHYQRDDDNTKDRYEVRWFKNQARVTSGITSATISVYDVDRVALINAQGLADVGASGMLLYTETSDRQTLGEPYEVEVTATVDGAARTWSQLLGRDI